MLKKITIILSVFFMISVIPKNANAQVIYETKSGDSLFKISNQYNMNLSKIAVLNGLTTQSKLVVGQSILVPGSTYIVQPGESIWKIATRHAVSIEALIKQNGLKTNIVLPGQN